MPIAPRLIVGNWKMNGQLAWLSELEPLLTQLQTQPTDHRIVLAPPVPLLWPMSKAIGGRPVALAGQDCHPEAAGAFTGDVSAEMLQDAGATLVILGHSERRTLHGESDALIADKLRAAFRAGLEPILCVGETLAERQAGSAVTIIELQLLGSMPVETGSKPFTIAYEPVWAIGTGLTPDAEDIQAMHAAIRAWLARRFGSTAKPAPILYGGSVKPSNASAILRLPEVGGALVGGASLKTADFLPIIYAD